MWRYVALLSHMNVVERIQAVMQSEHLLNYPCHSMNNLKSDKVNNEILVLRSFPSPSFTV